MIKRNAQPPPAASSAQNPTTYSYVYLRVQPFRTALAVPQRAGAEGAAAEAQESLQFLLYLADPSHQLTYSTVTQSVPARWLELWDEYEWVEDLVVEAIRVGVEVIGQEYIVARMGWDQKKTEDTQASSAEEPSEAKSD